MTEQPQHSPVEQTAQVVQTLQRKLAANTAKIAANAEARTEQSFSAHAEGDGKAKRALADLGDESRQTAAPAGGTEGRAR